MKTRYAFLLIPVICLFPFMGTAQSSGSSIADFLKFGPDDKLFLGPAIEYYESPYFGDEDQVNASLMFFYQTERLIINGPEIYVPIFKYAGLRLQYRTDGTGSDQISEQKLNGNKVGKIETREDSLDAGIYVGVLGFSLSYVSDILGVHDGGEFIFDAGKIFKAGNFEIVPRATIRFKNAALTDYYYGVSRKEANRSVFTEYSPDDSTVANAGLIVFYYLTPEWSINFSYDRYIFSDEIDDSEIVSRSDTNVAALGLTYHFFR